MKSKTVNRLGMQMKWALEVEKKAVDLASLREMLFAAGAHKAGYVCKSLENHVARAVDTMRLDTLAKLQFAGVRVPEGFTAPRVRVPKSKRSRS